MDIKDAYQKFLESTGVSIDTRTLQEGNIFFALAENEIERQAHIKEAQQKGAFLIVEENALQILQDIARMHRDSLSIPFFALTGSNGKTTTKELIRDVLSQKYKVHATTGNLNNHIGVPLTILSIPTGTEIAVIEMGASHQGEIATLCEIAKPTHGLITNIGKAHIGEMGGIEGIQKTKGELFNYIKDHKGVFFLNEEDSRLVIMAVKGMSVVGATYGAADVLEYHTLLLGQHNKQNIAAARAVGLFFGIEEEAIKKAISAYLPHSGRSEWLLWQGNKVLFDAYNANPSSMEIALESFADLPEISGDFKIAILGGMRELGTHQYLEHSSTFFQVRNFIEAGKLQLVYFVGPEFYEVYEKETEERNPKLIFFKDIVDLKNYFAKEGYPNAKTIFMKASKGPGKEPMLKQILAWE